MRTFSAILLTVFAFLAGTRAGRAEIRVAATVPDLAALAREIGGDLVTVRSLSLPGQDPHFVDAKPSLALEMNRADLLLLVGLDLEIGWVPTLLVGARNPKIQPGTRGHLDCSQFVTRLDVPGQAVDRSQGDIHPGGNPHYLYDPRAAEAVAAGIGERLAQIDPGHADSYRSNREAMIQRLRAARVGWEKALAPFRAAPVVGYHKTWTYLCDWLRLRADRISRAQTGHSAQPQARRAAAGPGPPEEGPHVAAGGALPGLHRPARRRSHPGSAGAGASRHQLPGR